MDFSKLITIKKKKGGVEGINFPETSRQDSSSAKASGTDKQAGLASANKLNQKTIKPDNSDMQGLGISYIDKNKFMAGAALLMIGIIIILLALFTW